MDRSKLEKAAQVVIGVIIIAAIAVGVFYYLKNNNEFSPSVVADDAKELVNKICKENGLSYRCVKITGMPKEDAMVKKEYELVAVMDNGTEQPILFRRYRENGKTMHSVEFINRDEKNKGGK